MALQDNPTRTELPRVLVAADPSVDPHRLVGLCCERAADDQFNVSLLLPADDDSGGRSERAARSAHVLRRTAKLLDAAGPRLEDVIVADADGREVDRVAPFGEFDALLVCPRRERALTSGLSLAVRSARLHGLTVLAPVQHAGGCASWMKRVFDPLGYRERPAEPAA